MTLTLFGYDASLRLDHYQADKHMIIPNAFETLSGPSWEFQVGLDVDAVRTALDRAVIRCDGWVPNNYVAEPTSAVIDRLFPKGRWQSWVTKQGKVWVDARGTVHEIARMDKDYCLNVIQFLHENHYGNITPVRTNPLIQALRDRVLA